MSLTGKQASFVSYYLGEARFNATRAAELAGYNAKGHSLEAIGSENLTRPAIRKAIEEHRRMARMSAEEVLIELTTLARGESKDKVRALALLSAHHGILDGKWAAAQSTEQSTEQRQKAIQHGWDSCMQEMNESIARYNAEADATNLKNEKIWQSVIDRYEHSPEATEALKALHDVLVKGTILKNDDALELVFARPQTIPPERRLEAAPIEKMMSKVIEPEIVEPELCRHGNPPGACNVIQLGYDCPNYVGRDESRYRYA